ncbi:VCBS repeat-containing protein [Frankia sp. AgPm24]|uniref:FG-GAP repeat domain-containing protein n=1 Tax=Frankia sp. AgPm24 TaxID=631128 RepID=UPI00200CA0A9|nr:VCBS repeat-containing protein [Frankia sp. AgPm24]MCK9924131.1 VCBS repeat-containing protein [Frankia sp. AgPm24]
MSTLEPNELTRLLSEAVDPIRPSADAYRQIRAGIDRRRRWRLPVFTLGGMVMAALIALAVVAIRPSPSNQLVEPAAPPVMPSNYTGPTQAGTGSGPSGSGSTHGGGQSSGGGGSATGTGGGTSTPSRSPGTRPTSPATISPTVSASPSSPSSSTGPGVNSPPLPSPAARPAGAGDIDGDGRSEDVSSDGATVRVTFSRDAVVARVTLPEISVPLTSAVVDIDGDGFGELLVQTSDSGGTKSYALLHYIGLDTLVAVALPTGLTLTSGTHTNTASGFRCGDHDLEISVGTSTDGNAFSVTTTALTLSRDGLTVTGSPATSTVRLPSDTSPFVPGCGSLS